MFCTVDLIAPVSCKNSVPLAAQKLGNLSRNVLQCLLLPQIVLVLRCSLLWPLLAGECASPALSTDQVTFMQ